jgi:hypothetical protein
LTEFQDGLMLAPNLLEVRLEEHAKIDKSPWNSYHAFRLPLSGRSNCCGKPRLRGEACMVR